MPLHDSPNEPSALRRGLVRNFGISMAVGVAVALFLGALNPGPSFARDLLYSLCISGCCWASIDGGRVLLLRTLARAQPGERSTGDGWPAVGWIAALVVVGGFLGYAGGATIANAITGGAAPMPWRAGYGPLVVPFTASAVATILFYNRSRIARQEAAAEAARRLATQTQLRLLQSQLEPHMLFNTLANLRALIALDAPRAQQMLDHLIAFLRASLQASRRESHALSAEFERTADYLALMQVRMGPRLATVLELPAPLAELAVPPLLLQPLVENAIQHGLEPHRPGGRLEVRAAREGEMLCLTVRDNGAGLGHAAAVPGTGFGSAQVRERLAVLYGEAASLTIESVDAAEGGGTRATVRLPLPSSPSSAPPRPGADAHAQALADTAPSARRAA